MSSREPPYHCSLSFNVHCTSVTIEQNPVCLSLPMEPLCCGYGTCDTMTIQNIPANLFVQLPATGGLTTVVSPSDSLCSCTLYAQGSASCSRCVVCEAAALSLLVTLATLSSTYCQSSHQPLASLHAPWPPVVSLHSGCMC